MTQHHRRYALARSVSEGLVSRAICAAGTVNGAAFPKIGPLAAGIVRRKASGWRCAQGETVLRDHGISGKLTAAALGLLAAMVAGEARTDDTDRATVLVLDASGSMWGQLADGRTKIEVARDVLGGFFRARDAAVPLGVIAYGHNRKGDCRDIEVIAGTGVQDAAVLSARLMAISPKGKTPLGQSLRLAAGQIPKTAEEADIVLVTDGLETCDVDPCAVAAELAQEGIRIRAHVVGFGLTAREAEALACVPEKTGGLLMTPQTGGELADALVRTTSAAPPPPPPEKPVRSEVPGLTFFEGENFEGQSFEVTQDVSNLDSVPFAPGLDGDANDSAYSVRVRGRWEICTDADYSGECQVISEDQPMLGPYSGSITSVRQVDERAQAKMPKGAMRNRGPYTLGTVHIDLGVLAEGSETGGAALALRLYRPGGGEALTYSTVEGREGAKDAAITIDQPGQYRLRFESWGGDVLDSMDITAEADPAVTLVAAPAVEPGHAIAVESVGSQRRDDTIEIWQGETRLDWGHNLGEMALGAQLVAPSEPGIYDLVYMGYNGAQERVEKARMSIEVGTVRDDASGDGMPERKAEADMGHGPDDGQDGRPWQDYPFHCLGEQACEMRDAATNLAFTLPAGWVADQPASTPMSAGAAAAGEVLEAPFVEFFEARGNLNRILLNPRQWLADNGPCVVTRAGQLCLWRNDAAPDDANAFEALGLLQVTLTTGRVIRRCPLEAACTFTHPAPPLAGKMPAGWSVEAGRLLANGAVATWFFDRDPGGNFKLIGLNQEGGEDCRATPAGPICAFTPYIASDEADMIVEDFLKKKAARPMRLPDPVVVDARDLRKLATILESQR